MKYALIGCGRVSPNHLNAAKNNGFDIISVCDTDNGHIDIAFGVSTLTEEEAAGIHRYSDWCEMLDSEKPELVEMAMKW